MKKKILIYRDLLLPYSETFIPSQVEAFLHYQGIYVGTESTDGLFLPPDRTRILFENIRAPRKLLRALKLLGWINPGALRQIAHLDAELLHAHFGYDAACALPIAKHLKIPFVVTFHGSDLLQLPEKRPFFAGLRTDPFNASTHLLHTLWVLRRIRSVFRSADLIIATSQDLRSHLIESGCPAHKIQVVYMGIDPGRFKRDPAIPTAKKILFVGNLIDKKGVDDLLRAMVAIQEKHPVYRLEIVGDGPERARLEALVQDLKVTCDFTGMLSHAEVRTALNQASIFCLPSKAGVFGDREAVPIAILEAMAMELPVVATRIGGISEAVIDGETGLLVPEQDPQAIAAALIRLIEEPCLRARLATAARLKVEQEFSAAENSSRLETYYDQLLAKI